MRIWDEWEKVVNVDNDDAPVDYNLTELPIELFDLCEASFRQLKRNDPEMCGLNIERGNWIEGTGSAIGQSKCLASLVIDAGDTEMGEDVDWIIDVFQGLSNNRSVQTFHFAGPAVGLSEHFQNIIGFIGHNSNLQYVNVSLLWEESFRDFVSALKGCNGSHLKRLDVSECEVPDKMGAKFFESLVEHPNLLELGFFCNSNRSSFSMKQSGRALSKLLNLQASKIRHLELSGEGRTWRGYDVDCVDDLSEALEVNTTLFSLTLRFQTATTMRWRRFSRALSQTECSLEWLDLSDNDFDDDAMTCLGVGLATNTKLQYLNVSKNSDITIEGWEGFVICLENPLSALKRINVNSCNIGDEGARAFASSLVNNHTLRSLHMARNSMSSTGWIDFFNVLLTSNSTFEHLTLHNDELTEESCWNALACTLCDASSIDNIFSSNHTFFNIGQFYEPINNLVEDAPGNVRSLLRLNEMESRKSAARTKILNYHFSGGNKNVHEFSRMPMTSMPFAVEWIGRNKLGFSLMYYLVRSDPSVFVPMPTAAVKKRKQM